MQGWWSLLMTWTSSTKFAMCLFLNPLFLRYFFTATSWPNSFPRKTWPYPPFPIGLMIYSCSFLMRKVNLIPFFLRYSDTLATLKTFLHCMLVLSWCFCSWFLFISLPSRYFIFISLLSFLSIFYTFSSFPFELREEEELDKSPSFLRLSDSWGFFLDSSKSFTSSMLRSFWEYCSIWSFRHWLLNMSLNS